MLCEVTLQLLQWVLTLCPEIMWLSNFNAFVLFVLNFWFSLNTAVCNPQRKSHSEVSITAVHYRYAHLVLSCLPSSELKYLGLISIEICIFFSLIKEKQLWDSLPFKINLFWGAIWSEPWLIFSTKNTHENVLGRFNLKSSATKYSENICKVCHYIFFFFSPEK